MVFEVSSFSPVTVILVFLVGALVGCGSFWLSIRSDLPVIKQDKTVAWTYSAFSGLFFGVIFAGVSFLVMSGVRGGDAPRQLQEQVSSVYGIDLTEAQAGALANQKGFGHFADQVEPGTVEVRRTVMLLVDGEELTVSLVWYGDEWILAEGTPGDVVELERRQ